MKLLKKFVMFLNQWLKTPQPNTDFQSKPVQPDKPTNPIAQELAPTPYEVLRMQLGVAEKTHAELIRKYHAAAGIDAGPELSWCSSVLIWSYKQAKVTLPESVNAWAPSWKNGGAIIQYNDIKSGDIVGVDGLGKSGTHVGMVVKKIDQNKFIMIAGNDGNMVRETTRSFNEIQFIRWYQ